MRITCGTGKVWYSRETLRAKFCASSESGAYGVLSGVPLPEMLRSRTTDWAGGA